MNENLQISHEQDTVPVWGNLSNPLDFDPTSFRFLLHIDSGVTDPLNLDAEPVEYLVNNCSILNKMETLSSSLVDQDHPVLFQGTSACHGLILSAPESSILATNYRDIYTQDKTYDEIVQNYPVQDPDKLMESTQIHDHNEVLLRAKEISAQAFFWVEPQDPTEETPFSKEQIRELADAAGLPLVELPLIKH